MKRVISIALVSIFVTACSPASSSTPTILPNSATVSLSTVPAASATPLPFKLLESPSPDSTTLFLPTATATLEPAEETGVSSAQLLNAKQGWAIVRRSVFWTEDAGRHWRQMPPHMSSTSSIGNAFFLDPQHAWVLVCESQNSDSVIKIAYTTDGGSNWTLSALASVVQLTSHADNQWCARLSLGWIFFLDAQQGWVMVDHTETMNSYMGELFQTLDGGQTWHRLASSPSGEFRFVSRTLGWMRATCCTGGAWQLYRTQDGGKTWKTELVSGAGQASDFFLPVFLGQQEGILAAILRDDGVPGDGITFFKSHDGGATWETTGKLAIVSDSLHLGGVSDVQVLNDKTWVVSLPGSGVFWTTDGGQHWRKNTSTIALSILRLALGSPTSGWGLECEQGAAPECVGLVATEDMGAHWERISMKP